MKKILVLMVIAIAVIFMIGCESEAAVASRNASVAADNFEIYRRAVFYNGITNEYILVVEGYLSIEDQGRQLEVTVKDDGGNYLKHFLGLSDNVTYFVEQLASAPVSGARYRVMFRPQQIIPTINLDVD